MPEAVFCQGKTPEQVVAIVRRLAEAHDNVLATRAEPAVVAALAASGLPCQVHEAARLVVVKPVAQRGRRPDRGGQRRHLRPAGGRGGRGRPRRRMGNRVERVYDCGVAGLHRLVPHLDRLSEANAIIAVAGMEGALPSVRRRAGRSAR